MTQGRFQCVQGPGESRWFAGPDVLREAYRNGVISASALVFDSNLRRWYLLADHESVQGVEPLPTARARANQRVSSTSTVPERSAGLAATSASGARQQPATVAASAWAPWKRLAFLASVFGIVALMFSQGGQRTDRIATNASPATERTAAEPNVDGWTKLDGLVTNYGTAALPAAPTTGYLSIELDPSDASSAMMTIGSPLGGSGPAAARFWSDSVLLTSVSAAGDSIAWMASVRGDRLEGSYVVFGGSSFRQGGRWWVTIDARGLELLRSRPERPDSVFVESAARVMAPFAIHTILFSKGTP